MSITKTWVVNTLQRELADGYVNKVMFQVDGTDGTYATKASSVVDLEKPNTLIPYKDLTPEIVISWVKAKLGADKVAEIEAAIDEEINLQKAPKYGVGTPWQ